MSRADPLADRWHLAYLSYVVLGCGCLFPWNAYITASDYFEAQYPGRHADRLFTVCYLPVNLAVLVAVVRHHSRLRPVVRIVGGFIGFTVAVSAVPLLDMAGPGDAALGVILGLVALCGVCDGIAQGALFGDAASLPPRFTQALVSGTALSGVVVCLLRVVTKATLPDTPEGLRASASAYFTLAALVCASCVVLYWVVVPRLPIIRHYRQVAVTAALAEAVEWGASAGASTGPGKGAGALTQLLNEGGEGEEDRLKLDEGSPPGGGSPRSGGGFGGPPLAGPPPGLGRRVASPERLTDMLEEEPAQHAHHSQQGRRSVDLELVPDDWYPVDCTADHCDHYGQGGPERPSTMHQALLDRLSDSYYSVAGENAEGEGLRAPALHQQLHCQLGSSAGATFQHSAGGAAQGSGAARWDAASWRGGAKAKAGGAPALAAPAPAGQLGYTGVLRQLWRFAVANVIIYTVTLSIFPGVLAEDVSSARLGSWYPVVLITVFNFADWAGKSTPVLAALRLRDERAILWATLSRVLFVPAFLLAATGGSGPVVIGLLTLLLGLSNGYLTSCSMIGAPERVPASAAELTGNLMVLSLVLGLCIGAACGFLWLL